MRRLRALTAGIQLRQIEIDRHRHLDGPCCSISGGGGGSGWARDTTATASRSSDAVPERTCSMTFETRPCASTLKLTCGMPLRRRLRASKVILDAVQFAFHRALPRQFGLRVAVGVAVDRCGGLMRASAPAARRRWTRRHCASLLACSCGFGCDFCGGRCLARFFCAVTIFAFSARSRADPAVAAARGCAAADSACCTPSGSAFRRFNLRRPAHHHRRRWQYHRLQRRLRPVKQQHQRRVRRRASSRPRAQRGCGSSKGREGKTDLT